MKLYQLSLFLGLLSNFVFDVLTQSWSPLVEMSLGIQRLATFLLLILPAGIGSVLGVMSLNRKEAKAWWAIGVSVLNILMVLLGLLHLIFVLSAG